MFQFSIILEELSSFFRLCWTQISFYGSALPAGSLWWITHKTAGGEWLTKVIITNSNSEINSVYVESLQESMELKQQGRNTHKHSFSYISPNSHLERLLFWNQLQFLHLFYRTKGEIWPPAFIHLLKLGFSTMSRKQSGSVSVGWFCFRFLKVKNELFQSFRR